MFRANPKFLETVFLSVNLSHLLLTDLAEYVLNKCITQPQPERQISINGEYFVDSPSVTGDQPVHYNIDYLEDEDGKISHKHHGNHILDWMVSQNIMWVMIGSYIIVCKKQYSVWV